MNNPNDDSFTIAENHAFNDLNLVANTKVLSALYCFQDLRIRHLKYNDVEEYDTKYSEAFTSLIKEMRLELHGMSENPNHGLKELYMLAGILKK